MADRVIPIFSQIDDGRNGRNRARGVNLLGVDTDLEAVEIFLKQHKGSPETHRAYSREINRLLLWSMYVPRKSLSNLLPDDFIDYATFLQNPPENWRGVIMVGHDGNRSKPFQRPLSNHSQRHALSIVGSLLAFLVKHGYLEKMPMYKLNLVQRPNTELQKRQVRERQLDRSQWQVLTRWFDSQITYDAQRARFAANLMLYLGLRVSEVARSNMGQFLYVRNKWIFTLAGKGQVYAELQVPDAMLQELVRYRKLMRLSPLPTPNEKHPLIVSSEDQYRAVTARRISQLIKDALDAASKTMPVGEAKDQMKACSPHWFRHMYVQMMADMGMQMEDVQKNARHRKIETTFLYTDAKQTRRHAAVESMNFKEVL